MDDVKLVPNWYGMPQSDSRVKRCGSRCRMLNAVKICPTLVILAIVALGVGFAPEVVAEEVLVAQM